MYNNRISMKDLFQNKELSNILPQFKDEDLKNVQSFDWVNDKIKEYIKNALNAEIDGDEIIVNGKKSNVLQSLQRMKYTLEAFFNAMPSIVKNIRKDTKLYLPYSNLAQIKSLKDEKQKIFLLNSILKKYDLYPFKNKKPRQLSGGMRQRVALIRTLVLNPALLLLDEPFSALDFQTRLKVCDDVYEIIKSENKTALLVTHDISEALSMSDKIIVLSKRPAHVKEIYEINFEGASPLAKREDKDFGKYFEMIWRNLV